MDCLNATCPLVNPSILLQNFVILSAVHCSVKLWLYHYVPISIIKSFHDSKKKNEFLYDGSDKKDNSINNSLKGNLDQNILVTYIKLTIFEYNWY